jgi:glycosyltransferase involved in cell wall biosynthesis
MSCGAALTSTDNGGARVYARHGRNALLSPPGRPEALAENVLQLLNDSALRRTLARQGHSDIREFTWPKAIDSMERLIEELLSVKRQSQGLSTSRASLPSKLADPKGLKTA